LRAAHQVEAHEAGDFFQVAFALTPVLDESLLMAAFDPEAIHGNEHGAIS